MKEFTLQQAIDSGHNLIAPITIKLETGQLSIEKMLRILPGKRIVAKTEYQNKTVVVKLFLQHHNLEQEITGYKLLEKTGVATPRLLHEIKLAEGGYCFYEYLENAISLDELWKQADKIEKANLLEQLLDTLKKMFETGVYQTDLHLGNFVCSNGSFYTLDPASCVKLNKKAQIEENLALLQAQFRLQDWPQTSLTIAAKFPFAHGLEIENRARTTWKSRIDTLLKKIYRDCSYIEASIVSLNVLQKLNIYCVRVQNSKAMRELLEKMTPLPAAEFLKRGNSSQVFSIDIDNKKFVVKNSRNANIWKTLRRCFKRSRASNSWYFSHLLREAGVSVPAPIALVERKLGPLVLESWFVSEYIGGDNLLDVWLYQIPSETEIQKIKNLFNTMKTLKISHGDMKATNLLVADDDIYLIDFDGMRQHRFKFVADYFLQKDRERLLRNWPKKANKNWLW